MTKAARGSEEQSIRLAGQGAPKRWEEQFCESILSALLPTICIVDNLIEPASSHVLVSQSSALVT